MIHWMPCRNPSRLHIHTAFAYSHGPRSVVWSDLNPAPPFPPMRVLEVYRSRALNLVCEVTLSWDDNTCKLIYDKCHYNIYHNDIKYHMTLNTIFSVVATTCAPCSWKIRDIYFKLHNAKRRMGQGVTHQDSDRKTNSIEYQVQWPPWNRD